MAVEMAKKRKAEEESTPTPPHDVLEVSKAVLAALGRPKDLLKVTTVHLYHTRYRVNVFRHTEVDNRTHITDTHFVIFGPDGIVEARPPIVKKY